MLCRGAFLQVAVLWPATPHRLRPHPKAVARPSFAHDAAPHSKVAPRQAELEICRNLRSRSTSEASLRSKSLQQPAFFPLTESRWPG